MNNYCPKLCRELIILQPNIHIIPRGCDSFLVLSKKKLKIYRWPVEWRVTFVGVFCCLFFQVSWGADEAKDVIDLSRVSGGAIEEEKQEIRLGRRR